MACYLVFLTRLESGFRSAEGVLAFVIFVDFYLCNFLHAGEDGFLPATVRHSPLSSMESHRNQASRYQRPNEFGQGLGTARASWLLINSVLFKTCLIVRRIGERG